MYISLSLAHGHLSPNIHVWHMCLPHETLLGTQVFLVPHSLIHMSVTLNTLWRILSLPHVSLMKQWLWHVCPCFMVRVSRIIFSLVYVSVMKHFLKLVCLLWNIFSLAQVSVSQNTLPLPHVSLSVNTLSLDTVTALLPQCIKVCDVSEAGSSSVFRYKERIYVI